MHKYLPFAHLVSLFFVWNTDLFAASFNCNQASTPQEKYICQNEEILKLDVALAKAYQEQMNVLPKDAQSMVQTSQRSWLTFWPMTCSASASALKLDVNSKDCVLDAYRSRIIELNTFSSIKSSVTYKVSEYRYIAPKTADEVPSNHTISFPQVVAQFPNDASLNAWLAKDLTKWRAKLDVDSDTELSVSLIASGSTLIHALEVQHFFWLWRGTSSNQ